MTLTDIRSHFAKRSAYRHTVDELRSLPLAIRVDLDIAGIEEKVAHKAVYG